MCHIFAELLLHFQLSLLRDISCVTAVDNKIFKDLSSYINIFQFLCAENIGYRVKQWENFKKIEGR